MKPYLFLSCETSTPRVADRLREIEEKLGKFDVTPYSDTIYEIGIIVNCFDDALCAAGFGKPRILLRYAEGRADIRLPMPYVAFQNADEHTQYLMTVRNIVESVRAIDTRCKKSKRAKFDGDGMIAELLRRLELSPDLPEGISGVIK